MTPAIPEILPDSSPRKRRIITHSSRIGSVRCQNDRIIERSVLFQCIHQRSHRRSLLTDSYINTIQRVTVFIIISLIDNRIDGDSRFPDLTVADDQLSLSTADRNHRVYRLDTGLQRLVHRLTENNTRSLTFKRQSNQITLNGTGPVNGFTQRIDDPP